MTRAASDAPDPALAAWTAAHVAWFRRVGLRCECFACVAARRKEG